ncbi:MAG: sulfatase-like hydrolase/transferase [Anaerolineae bacterium]|nr:MAG: sulfatase-like hydrolase/transferase [Anaerolineae bacterium]
MNDRPNFLILCTDQMRADHMGCAGNPAIRTPHLDALAAGGVHLSRAYVNCPLCMPGRATLFTGLTPRGHRVRTNGIPLDPSFPTVPGALAEAGYRTASIGKIHLTNYGYRRHDEEVLTPPEAFPELIEGWRAGRIRRVPTPYYGLQHVEITVGHGTGVHGDYALWLQREHPHQWARLGTVPPRPSRLGAEGCGSFPLEEPYHHTAYVADRTIAYLRQATGQGAPFFLICSFPDPHHPYYPPQPWDRAYSPEEIVPPVGREGELNDLAPFFRQIYEEPLQLSGRNHPTRMPQAQRLEILAYTYGMVSLIDRHIGRVLAALDELGLTSDTAVLFLSDHGDLMGDHGLLNKGPFHFEGLLRVPMIWRWPGRFRPRHSPALASLLDVPPTILDLAGVPIPEGPTSPEAPQQPPAWPGRSLMPLLTGQRDAVQDSVAIENDEDYLGLRLRTLVTPTHKITTYTGHRGPEPYGELFDLADDPHELHNLWADPGHAARRGQLIEALHHRLTETDITLPRRLGHA